MVAFPARVKYDPNLVAPEWFRWLHKTRHDPPTPAELQQCAPAPPARRPGPWRTGPPPGRPGPQPAGAGEVQPRSTSGAR